MRRALHALFNTSLHRRQFPEVWKVDVTHPLHKAGKPRDECNNYRPIALLSCVGKLMTKIIARRLVEYVTLHSRWSC